MSSGMFQRAVQFKFEYNNSFCLDELICAGFAERAVTGVVVPAPVWPVAPGDYCVVHHFAVHSALAGWQVKGCKVANSL